MLEFIKNRYLREKKKHAVDNLKILESRIKKETSIKNELLNELSTNLYYELEEKLNRKLNLCSSDIYLFESILYKQIRLIQSMKESVTTGDVANYTPPIGGKPRKRKIVNGIPIYESTWEEFQYFIDDEKNKKLSDEDKWKNFLKDKELDDDFKMELMKHKNDKGAYLQYLNYLVKLNKNKKTEK